jgi:hypothetical protein
MKHHEKPKKVQCRRCGHWLRLSDMNEYGVCIGCDYLEGEEYERQRTPRNAREQFHQLLYLR